MGQLTAGISSLKRLFGTEDVTPPPAFLSRELPDDVPPPLPAQDCAAIAKSPKDRARQAFKDIPLNEREKQAISALLEAPGSTAPELSAACGWMTAGWRTQMLLLCQRRRHNLWPGDLATDITNGIIITALADYDPDSLRFHPRKGLKKILKSAVAA